MSRKLPGVIPVLFLLVTGLGCGSETETPAAPADPEPAAEETAAAPELEEAEEPQEATPPPTPEVVNRLLRPTNRCSEAERCNQVGLANYRRDNYEVALTFFAKALELAPGHEKAAFNAACMFAKLGEVDGALHMLRQVLAMNTEASRQRLTRVATDGDFDGIRSNPAFQEENQRIQAAAAEQAQAFASASAGAEPVTNELMVEVRRQIKGGDIAALAARTPEGERIEIRYDIEENCSQYGNPINESQRTVSRGGDHFADWLRNAHRSWRRACRDEEPGTNGCLWEDLVILMNPQCSGDCCVHSQNSRARSPDERYGSGNFLWLEKVCFAPQSGTEVRRISEIEFSGSECFPGNE